MDLLAPIRTLDHTPLGEWVQSNEVIFPTLEALHVIAAMLVFGSIAMLDLRLLGLSSRGHAVTKVSNEVLPWTWVSFVVAVVTGALMFAGQSEAYLGNREFQIKLVLIVLAGVNLAVFHYFTWSTVQTWGGGTRTPIGAKLAATFSLSLWVGVVIAGRWIGWTLTSF